MAGSATLTTEPSMNTMLEPRMVAASTHGLARSAQVGVPRAAAWITPSSHGFRATPIIPGPGCSRLSSRLPRPIFGGAIEHRPDRGDQWRARRVLASVVEIESVVEVGRVPPLGVLENRLQLVERLGEPRLGRLSGLVLVPKP